MLRGVFLGMYCFDIRKVQRLFLTILFLHSLALNLHFNIISTYIKAYIVSMTCFCM